MSKYTTQIRSIVESGTPLFDFTYPIFDVNYRPVLESKIIDHFYFREIGLETVEQFKHFLKSKLNMIMPYYNQLYPTIDLIDKDNYNLNLNTTETHTKTTRTDATGLINNNVTSDTTGTDKDVFQDTPQSKLGSVDYATNVTDSNRTAHDETISQNTNENTVDYHEDYIITMMGGGGMRYNSDILMEWRKTFINVDQMVINELNDLFMNVY